MKDLNLYKLLFEQDEAEQASRNAPEDPVTLREPKVKARPAPDSVDDQIDALILRYESSSIRKEEITINESLKNLNLKTLLEQEGDDDPVEEPEEEPVEEPVEEPADPEGSEAMGVTEPAGAQKIPDLDVDAFAARVIRLLMNYKNLLRIEDAILNRTKNFLDENYGDAFVNKFLDTIEQQYGLETSEFENVKYAKDEEFAVGAFAGGTGGLGGGGG
jgi:hypothetical protein